MKLSCRTLPGLGFGNKSSKVADLETTVGQGDTTRSEELRPSTSKSAIISHEELEEKFNFEGYLEVYDLPPAFTPDFLMLYKISSFKRKFEDTILNISENITNTIDDLIRNTYSVAMSMTEINCFLWLGAECLAIVDSNPTPINNTDFKNWCKNQLGTLAQSAISSKKMTKSFRRKMVPFNNLLHVCFQTVKQDYSKQSRHAKTLFKEYLVGAGNKVNFQGKDVLGKIRICSHKTGFSIMCKERWENGEGIPRKTLEELVKLSLTESFHRMKHVRNDFSKIFPLIVRNRDLNLGDADTNCSTFQINVDKVLRLLQFREMKLEEKRTTEILLAFLKLEKLLNQLGMMLIKLGNTAKYLSGRLTKIEKRMGDKKFKLRKNKSPYFPRKSSSIDGGLLLGLMNEWSEFLK